MWDLVRIVETDYITINTASTRNDSNNTASYTNTKNRLVIIITLLIILVLAFVLLRIL